MQPNHFNQEKTNSNEVLTPRDLINKHMRDPDHIVTEDEFRKVIVGEDDNYSSLKVEQHDPLRKHELRSRNRRPRTM